MADNVNITEGSGKVIAADDVSNVFYQKVKIDQGADGATSPVTKSDPLRVVYGSRTRVGAYLGNSGVQTVLATAHASTAGFCWLINPAASGIVMALRKVDVTTQIVASTAFATAPRITLERMTFTGTYGGTSSVTCGKHDSTDAAQVGLLLADAVSLTATAGAVLRAFFPTVTVGVTSGAAIPFQQTWSAGNDDETVVLRAGEGLVLRQADNGTTSDTRKLIASLQWEEF